MLACKSLLSLNQKYVTLLYKSLMTYHPYLTIQLPYLQQDQILITKFYITTHQSVLRSTSFQEQWSKS